MKFSHYYTLAEAEEIRTTFASWIGKTAHIGAGSYRNLKNIAIREDHESSANKKVFYVEFEFEDERVFSAYEFSVNNGLIPLQGRMSA